ncbi:mucin-5AC isoform X2 [Vanessa atalanta]|uniref:mucin-5AC isoform X2 n=1 Tax=Vanessa atalanta TaxID=42275 RepID=UPI001FCDFC44|nr:mucin-5AC isoform X2 [Vanessa atalanta]
MGNFDGRKCAYLKMEYTTWLFILIAAITLATPALSSSPRVVCYYTNWSVYRPGTAKFNPQNINPYLCTHLVYAFGGFTKDNTLKPFDKYQDIEKGGYAKFTGLKTYNKNLKTLLAIGGWNEGSSRFSPMVAAKDRRREFVRNVIKFLRQNHFDGLDLDWEYPAFRDGGKPKDRENYAKLVKELREEFERESEKTGKPRLLLTMAVPAGIEYILKGFDVKTLNRYLDWMNLLTYDYHSAFEPAVNHHAPLYPLEEPNEYSVDNELNIDYTIKFYLENGADADKLVLGIPTYGRSYTLFNADAVEIGSPADGPGEQGDATREKGYLAYYEICEALKPKNKKRAIASDEEYEEDSSSEEEEEEEEDWTVMYPNKNAMGPVAYKGNQWVGYDDIDIVKKKAEYVAENGLGGIMFWSIDNDDFRGTCHGKPYPLIEAAKEAYVSKLGSTDRQLTVKEKPKQSRAGGRRRNRPKSSSTTTTTTTTTTTPKPTKSNKRKSASTSISTTPSWNIITPEPPTTPDAGSDFKCKDEGFFQHPRDCKKYFWCLDSGPSDLGIVAHQFTCPSGLYFNKAADSCDFARNVLCKKPTATTKAITKPTTAKTTVSTTTTTTTTTTTRRPIRLTSRSSLLFRTSSTTTTTPEPELSEEDEEEEEVGTDEAADIEAEDPKVIKELIDLIKKVGGVEQLEKQLKLSETPGATVTVPPSAINTKLYQRVLERTRGRNKYGDNSITENPVQNSRRGPQNAGIEPSSDTNKLLRKERPQYVTINRSRPTISSTTPLSGESEEEEEEESEEVPQISRTRVQQRTDYDTPVGTTAKPLQYVNIRRSRPTTAATEAPDDSRNALFERVEPYVAVAESPNSLDIASSRRENTPEYVTIRRTRPTAETTTLKHQESEEEEESQETALEREISSQSVQPQYTSVVRTRSTTLLPLEEPSSPEPTTILSVQISSLLNEPSSEEVENPPETSSTITQTTELPEPETITTSTTTITTTPTTTTSTTTPSPSTLSTRVPLLRRRGSTTPTTTAVPISTTQAVKERRPFLRRTKATAPPDVTETDGSTTVETTTNKFTRGNNRFKLRKTEKTTEKPRENSETKSKLPSSSKPQTRNDRPRNFVRRRLGGANSTSPKPSTTTLTPVALSRRPFRVASRRRPISSTTSTTTTPRTTTAFIESEESLQDIGDIDAIEDPSLKSNSLPRTTTSAQRRRPLIQLKSDQDQSPSATNEDEKKRQSKKYSSSFKQNQLDEILKLRGSAEDIDITTEGRTTLEDISAETAVALAAHQLLAAPIPIIPDYDDEPNPTRKTPQTIVDYKFTSPEYTEDFTKGQTYLPEYSRTPAYTSKQRTIETSTNSYTSHLTEPDTPSSTRSSSDTRLPTYTTTGAYTSRNSRPIDSTNKANPTIPGVTLRIGSEGSGESTARYTNIQNEINPSIYTTNNYESRVSKPGLTTNILNPTTAGVSLNLRESTLQYTASNRDVSPTYPTAFTSKVSRPSGFSPNLVNIDEVEEGKSTVRYQGSNLRGPSTRKPPRRKTIFRRISTTQSPTSVLPQTTQKPRRTTRKPFEKIAIRKNQLQKNTVQQETIQKEPVQKKFVQKTPVQKNPVQTVQKPNRPRPITDYDYYDASQEEVADKYEEGTKVILHAKGNIECLDIGNFPHPSSCKKFISCARMESGAIIGWEYICPKGLSFDPVGGICNWSAGLGCFEKDT